MPNLDKNGCVPFSVRLKPDECALLLRLRQHLEQKSAAAVSQSEVIRDALKALAAKESRRGFKP